jgi:hypothetical protein
VGFLLGSLPCLIDDKYENPGLFGEVGDQEW